MSVGRRALRLALLLSTLSAAGAGQYFLSLAYAPAPAAIGWGLAAAGFVLLHLLDRGGRALPGAREHDVPWRVEVVLAGLVLVVGVFFKVARLDVLPNGLNHDAAWEGQYALAILEGAPYTPYISAAWGRETLTFYFRAITVWMFGNEPIAVYAPSIVAGILTLPFFYGLARNLFGVQTALLATALFGVSGWTLVFSRVGWRSDFQPLFTILTLFFLTRGLRSRRYLDFLLAGIALAATVNTYNAARVFPGVVGGWILLLFLQWRPWTGFLRQFGPRLLAFSASFAVAVAPLAWYAFHNWEKFHARATYLTEGKSAFANLPTTLLLFHLRANGDDFFTSTPGLEFATAIFVAFGLLWVLLRPRDERSQLLLLGLVIGVIPGMISSPNLNRNIGTLPFLFLLGGLGVVWFVRELGSILGRPGRRLGTAFGVGVAITAAVTTWNEFLGDSRRPVWGFYPETTVVGRYMASLPADHEIVVAGGNFPKDTLIYLNYRSGDPFAETFFWLERPEEALTLKLAPHRRDGLVYIVPTQPPGPAVLGELQQRYPEHRIDELRAPWAGDQIFARALVVGAEAAAAAVASAPVEPEAEAPAAPAGQLQQPRGLARRSDGALVVCDFGHDRLQWFDAEGAPLTALGRGGSGPLEFRQPGAVAVGANGRLFVADTWNHRLQVLSTEGRYEAQWLGDLYSPRGLALAPDGSVYVADSGNNRIVRFSAEGEKLVAWNGTPDAEALREPVGVAIDAEGNIVVADNGNSRLRIFTPDGKETNNFRVPGWQSEAFSEPQVAVAADGLVWVTVPSRHEVRAYNRDGKAVRRIRGGPGADQPFDKPMGIVLDPATDSVVITDLAGKLVRLPLSTATP